MRKVTLMFCFLFFLMLVNTFNCRCIQAKDNCSDEQIMYMLKSFYTSYIAIVAGTSTAYVEKRDSIRIKYCTANLLKKLKKQKDYDPFLKAQDANIECLKTLSVIKDSKKDNLYHVSFIEIYDNTLTTIKLIVVKQKGCYKIDAVW